MTNKNIYCTLFNHGYLDKGLVMIDSLSKASNNDFKLYIFAMDKKCYDVISSLGLLNVECINIEELEDDNLIKLKHERSFAEYCWTWTPKTLEYVFEKYNEEMCTYIDADIYFYSNPCVLIDEMLNADKKILLVEHRFFKNPVKNMEETGKYCVQFNTFINNEESVEALKLWSKSCHNDCRYTKKSGVHGDQFYLNDWMKRYSCCHELKNHGGGVAPWNSKNYLFKDNKDRVKISYNSLNYDLVFYHFQNIRYLPFGFVNLNKQNSNRIVKQIYINYINEIQIKRDFVTERFKIHFSRKKSTYKNHLFKFIQNYIMPFKIRRLSDLYFIKRNIKK